MSEIVDEIRAYYKARELVWPNFDDSMKFVLTEIAEVFEIDLARGPGYVRNHPESKPKFDKEHLAEELGDAVMMLIVAGMVENVDVIDAMRNKMKRKLDKVAPKPVSDGPISITGYRTATLTSEIQTVG